MDILNEIKVERLSPYHNIGDFYCEEPSLNNFLQKEALEHQKQRISFTTVYLHNDIIAGYITLATDSIVLELDNAAEIKDLDTRFPQLPALKLCRIARDLRYKGKALGVYMLEDTIAYGHSLNSPDNVMGARCRFITADIRNPSLIYNFYVPNGFEPHSDGSGGTFHYRYDLGSLPSESHDSIESDVAINE